MYPWNQNWKLGQARYYLKYCRRMWDFLLLLINPFLPEVPPGWLWDARICVCLGDGASSGFTDLCLLFALDYGLVCYKSTIVISLLSTRVSVHSPRHLPYLEAPGTHPQLSATTCTRCISKSLPHLVTAGQCFPNSPLKLLISPLICNARNLPSSSTPPYEGLWERERDTASPLHLQIFSESPTLGSPKTPWWPKRQCKLWFSTCCDNILLLGLSIASCIAHVSIGPRCCGDFLCLVF